MNSADDTVSRTTLTRRRQPVVWNGIGNPQPLNVEERQPDYGASPGTLFLLMRGGLFFTQNHAVEGRCYTCTSPGPVVPWARTMAVQHPIPPGARMRLDGE